MRLQARGGEGPKTAPCFGPVMDPKRSPLSGPVSLRQVAPGGPKTGPPVLPQNWPPGGPKSVLFWGAAFWPTLARYFSDPGSPVAPSRSRTRRACPSKAADEQRPPQAPRSMPTSPRPCACVRGYNLLDMASVRHGHVPCGPPALVAQPRRDERAAGFDGQLGIVAVDGVSDPRPKSCYAGASKSSARGALTHIAVVCSRTDVQPLLPQFFLGSHQVLRKKAVAEAEAGAPSSVRFLCRASSWATCSIIIEVLEAVAAALKPFVAQCSPTLLLDCAPMHISEEVFRAAICCGLRLVFVPARMTALLQPLDVFAFRRYKAHLRREYHALQLSSPSGTVSRAAWLLQLLARAASSHLASRRWARAFEGVGCGQAPRLHSNLKRRLAVQSIPQCPLRCPSAADVHSILPGRKRPASAALLLPRLPGRRLRGKAPTLPSM